MTVDHAHLERVFRSDFGRSVATLTRVFGDIDIPEDAVQDAFAIASARWPTAGLPPNAGAWITTTARNRAIDHLRREVSRHDRQAAALLLHAEGEEREEASQVIDDRLRLIFTTCHPAAAGRARDGRDRPGVPRAGDDDGAADRPGEAQDPRREHPVSYPR